MRLRFLAMMMTAAMLMTACGGVQQEGAGGAGGANQAPAGGDQAGQQQPQTPPVEKRIQQWTTPPEMQIDPTKSYTATVETDHGAFTIELFAEDAPKTVNNFVFLARQGYYDGVIFHRIVETFMIQGGDPTGTGRGGPGYRFDDELPPKRSYEPGIVAMANAGSNTNGSQFFICNGDACRNLDQIPNYTQFGRVIEGMDVVLAMSALEVTISASGERSAPVNPPVIQKITIAEGE